MRFGILTRLKCNLVLNVTSNLHLTFRGPCIVIYSYNKTNEMH